jgi:hypothetical protein
MDTIKGRFDILAVISRRRWRFVPRRWLGLGSGRRWLRGRSFGRCRSGSGLRRLLPSVSGSFWPTLSGGLWAWCPVFGLSMPPLAIGFPEDPDNPLNKHPAYRDPGFVPPPLLSSFNEGRVTYLFLRHNGTKSQLGDFR